jgi:hypothetical protein
MVQSTVTLSSPSSAFPVSSMPAFGRHVAHVQSRSRKRIGIWHSLGSFVLRVLVVLAIVLFPWSSVE